ncbi:unnamed protein product [Didymodactylos carnosus]|uniref:CxC5 like cysteine cluster associated with KDZ domain-containing protein n=1 Tax=Didymodactylos carnosus TaxID=1234261 RepID=A0A8S2FJU7_9BILA|nr:unnamed protein product [Didymodactylos carnosus]CAF4277566.1 unnamed protein product [Didymodactylos carnosus]
MMDAHSLLYDAKVNEVELVFLKLSKILSPKLIVVIIKLDKTIPNALKTKYQHITHIINMLTNKTYSKENIIHILSTIESNQQLQSYFDHDINVNGIIHDYKQRTDILDTHDICIINLLPFTNVCVNCNDLIIITKYVNVTVIGIDYNTHALLYHGNCKNCHMNYYHNYYCDNVLKIKYVQDKIIEKSQYLHFGGEFVFDRQVFVLFTANLLKSYMTFNGFSDAYDYILKELHYLNYMKK